MIQLPKFNWGEILVMAGFLLSCGASVAYFVQKDWCRGFYWAFAAGITAVVTWGLK